VELLVSISVIAMLLSLLLPAVQQARETGRRNTCANNIRNLGLAVLAQTEATRRFPASTYYHANSASNTQPSPNWVVAVLPRIERTDLAQRWNRTAAPSNATNQAVASIHIDVLCCPDDPSLTGGGDLSYCANGGVGFTAMVGGIPNCPLAPTGGQIDLNGNGVTCPPLNSTTDGSPDDRSLLTMLGLFFGESGGPTGTTRHHTPDSVYDGLSQTFMLAENVRTGVDPITPETNWGYPDPHYTMFYFSPSICQSLKCSKGNVNYALANNSSEGINASLTEPEGSPWPSSFHAGDGVNVVFADGHLRFITVAIEGSVYAALFSPQGQKLMETALQQALVEDGRIP
jgi:prepilin-type processing-associated H-X9-DG protein